MVLGLWFRAGGLGSVYTGMHGDSVWGIMVGSNPKPRTLNSKPEGSFSGSCAYVGVGPNYTPPN